LSYDISSFIVGNVFMIINFTFVPVVLKYIDNGKNLQAKKYIKNYFWSILFLMLPIVIFIFTFSPYMVRYILVAGYFTNETVLIVRLMGIGAFMSGIKAYFFDFSFQFGEKTNIQLIPIVVGAILNIIFNILLIPNQGIIGALYATL